MTPEEIQARGPFLKRIPLFKDLSVEDLHKVAKLLKPLSLPRGATLFQQGDTADAFYIITSGNVQLITERQSRKSLAGYVGRGDTLGELALLTGEPRAWTALLDATTEFLVLSKKDFSTVLRENPSILLQLSRTLSARLLQETRSGGGHGPQLHPHLLALLAALDENTATLFTLTLALSLVEQTRRRVLLVDMHPRTGTLATACGLKPLVVTQEMLRGRDLRDPKLLAEFVQPHVSGLGIVTLPPGVLSGRLYRSIFLLMNLFRDHSDFTLLALRSPLDDVEKAVLYEADQWMLVGAEDRRDEFLRSRSELAGFVPEPKRLLEAWLGDLAPEDLVFSTRRDWVRIPWPAELTPSFKSGTSPFQVMGRFPRSRTGIERLARRFASLRVGLALGTGAALGYALIGIIKAFEREHIPVDMVAGTSIGSLMGGLSALGMPATEIEELALGVDKAWVYENLFWDLTVPRAGIFAGTTLLRFLRSYFGRTEFHQLDLPFACVATDIETGEEIVFKEGPVAEAIRASCGIPLIFQPLPYHGRFLVDGGLVDPVPIKVLNQMGADILIAANLTMPAGERKSALRKKRKGRPALMSMGLSEIKDLTLPKALQSPHLFQILFQMIYTMEYEIAKSRSSLAHVNIHPDLSAFSWTEMHRAKEIIEAGEEIAETVMPKIKALLPYFSDACKVDIKRSHWA